LKVSSKSEGMETQPRGWIYDAIFYRFMYENGTKDF